MKKFLIISLSFLLLFNSFGYVIVYFEVKKSLKEEALEKMDDYISEDELDVIVLNKNDLQYYTNECHFLGKNEIKYKGKMYDIYRKFDTGDEVILYCINDEKENMVEKIFSSYIEDLNSKSSEQPAVRNILNTKISIGITQQGNSWLVNQITEFVPFNKSGLITNFLEVLTPPPKESFAI
jgi:hypothetical protein